MGRRKRAGPHLLADEKSELAVSRMGGAGARLWQSDALCLVEGWRPASGLALIHQRSYSRAGHSIASLRAPANSGCSLLKLQSAAERVPGLVCAMADNP